MNHNSLPDSSSLGERFTTLQFEEDDGEGRRFAKALSAPSPKSPIEPSGDGGWSLRRELGP